MKLLTYIGINSNFTYKNVCIYLYKFWNNNKVMTKKINKDFFFLIKYLECFILYNVILFVILMYYDIINIYVLYDLIFDNNLNIVKNVYSDNEMVHTFAPSDIKLHNSFFEKFIDLFKANSYFKYFPSYFVDSLEKKEKGIVYNLEPFFDDVHHQRVKYIYELESHVNEMYSSIKQYKSTVDWILSNTNNILCN